jgi:hypothetical protein
MYFAANPQAIGAHSRVPNTGFRQTENPPLVGRKRWGLSWQIELPVISVVMRSQGTELNTKCV